MNEGKRQAYIDKLTDNLPMLRKKLKLSQSSLADVVGVSSYTILAIEKRQRKMTWNTFLSLLLIFLRHGDTKDLLPALGIYTEELMRFIEGKETDEVSK